MDGYFRIINGKDILETWSLVTLDIPVHLNFELAFGRMGVYLSGGISGSYFLRKDYQASGIFDYRGYYPEYNLFLENLEDYGFKSNVNHQNSGELNFEPFYTSLDAAVGITIRFPKAKMLLYAGLNITNSITPLVGQYEENNFITVSSDQHQSILSEINYLTLDTYGFQIGVRKYIKRINKEKKVMRLGTY